MGRRDVALHPEGVDRNSLYAATYATAAASPSTRRAWIEITREAELETAINVALHPEGVDRNLSVRCHCLIHAHVALHPEGVDRNAARLVAPRD